MVYYNDSDPKAAAWLRNLIAAGLLPAGRVDGRDIREVRGDELRAYTHVHLFAGIGGWPLALQYAGWPADRPVWTGSCPCQPFSCAGKQKGSGDHRHLWPEMRRLISERAPAACFGEQVASKAGREWLAGVRADLEALGYAVGAADLCAAGVGEEAEIEIIDEFSGEVVHREKGVVGPPHIRQRLWWVADAGGSERRWWTAEERARGIFLHAPDGGEAGGVGDAEDARHARRQHAGTSGEEKGERPRLLGVGGSGAARGLEHANPAGCEQHGGTGAVEAPFVAVECPGGGDHGLADAQRVRRQSRAGEPCDKKGAGRGRRESRRGGEPDRLEHADRDRWAQVALLQSEKQTPSSAGGNGNPWGDFELVYCRDHKVRRIESGTFPLAARVPGDVGRLRGYGNVIVPQAAAEFIIAFLESESNAC